MVRRVSSKEARDNFAELLGSVYYTHEPIIVERKGKPYAVLISPDQYEHMEGGMKVTREERPAVRPRTPREKAQALTAVAEAKKVHAELLAERGGVPFDDSSEIIRTIREERSRHLANTT